LEGHKVNPPTSGSEIIPDLKRGLLLLFINVLYKALLLSVTKVQDTYVQQYIQLRSLLHTRNETVCVFKKSSV